MKKRLFMFALLSTASAAQAKSMKDFWQKRPADSPRFQSTKSSLALEMCLGMEMSEEGGPPVVLHGERETILTVITGLYQSAPIYGARILDHGASREIVVGAIQSGGWTNKASALVQRCV